MASKKWKVHMVAATEKRLDSMVVIVVLFFYFQAFLFLVVNIFLQNGVLISVSRRIHQNVRVI